MSASEGTSADPKKPTLQRYFLSAKKEYANEVAAKKKLAEMFNPEANEEVKKGGRRK